MILCQYETKTAESCFGAIPRERWTRMFGLGTTELLVLAAVVVLLFGASKLPQLGAGLGQGIRNFKKSMKDQDTIDVTPKDDEDKKEDSEKKKQSTHSSHDE